MLQSSVWYVPPKPSQIVFLSTLLGFGRRDVVEYLIQNGAKVDIQDDGRCLNEVFQSCIVIGCLLERYSITVLA